MDRGYEAGDLSVFPDAIDDRETLYEAKNNALTTLRQGLGYSAKRIIVNDATGFPARGLLRIGPPPGEAGNAELIYYDSRNDTTFTQLIRGFAGSRQTQWTSGTSVSNAVMAEHHNAVKDALINIQHYLGVSEQPDENSFHGILRNQEVRFLTPKASFLGYPLKGPPSLTVRFQNFSGGDVVRSFWDFGDGSVSTETNPSHVYAAEGLYTVKLNIVTSTGGQGAVTKYNYVEVSEDRKPTFFYLLPSTDKPLYSAQTALAKRLSGEDPTAQAMTFNFIDQSDGQIAERYWIFDDGEREEQKDPDIHTTTHSYERPGTYDPTLLLVFADQRTKRVFLSGKHSITVE